MNECEWSTKLLPFGSQRELCQGQRLGIRTKSKPLNTREVCAGSRPWVLYPCHTALGEHTAFLKWLPAPSEQWWLQHRKAEQPVLTPVKPADGLRSQRGLAVPAWRQVSSKEVWLRGCRRCRFSSLRQDPLKRGSALLQDHHRQAPLEDTALSEEGHTSQTLLSLGF